MRVFSKLFKNPYVWLCIFSAIYLVSRLTNLTSLPIFTDEAIYIRWSQIGATDASWRYISLTDGKQPLFTWFVMAALRVIKDPLVAGRLVSVVSGLFGMWGMYFLGREVFRRKQIGILSSFFYLISPFALMYDRFAIYDSLVAAISVWNLYIAILLVRYIRLDIALIFGMSLGVGMLTKTSAFLSLYLLPVTLLLFDWRSKFIVKRLLHWTGLSILSFIISQVIYSILRLSPYFYIIAQKNTIFVYPLKEWMTHPFTFLVGNLHGQFDWLYHYLTFPVVSIILITLFLSKKRIPEKVLLVLWWLMPFVGLALFGKVLYPRFILFMTMPLYVLGAYGLGMVIDRYPKGLTKFILIFLVSFYAVYLSVGVIFDIKHVAIPTSERGQYINDWPSGWGIAEIVTKLNEYSKTEPIAVYTEGTFGLLPYALEIYLHENKNIDIHGVWPPTEKISPDIEKSANTKLTFYITNLTQTVPDWPMEHVMEVQKGINPESHIRLYRIVTTK